MGQILDLSMHMVDNFYIFVQVHFKKNVPIMHAIMSCILKGL